MVEGLVKKPWLGRTMNNFMKKLKDLFPRKVKASKVVLPKPKKMSAEKALAFMLHRNISVETYNHMFNHSKNEEGFTVIITIQILVNITRSKKSSDSILA